MRTTDRDEEFSRRTVSRPSGPTGLAHRIERAEILDGPAEQIASAAKGPLGAPEVRTALSGSWLGHPLHPALIALPLGSWGAATLMDLVGERRAARKLVAMGLVAAAPTAVTGLSDWLHTTGAERRVGLVHMASNSAAAGAYLASWRARRREHHIRGAALSLAGAALAGVGGWLGGHLSYALGVGVDTNAFDTGPAEWTSLDVEVPAGGDPVRAVAGSTPVVASRQPDGVRVLAERCSHRGGPLSGGEVSEGCITCPWHGSRFDLATGSVRQGPAVVGQPAYEVRETDEGISVRRDEPRSLRSNSSKP